MVLNVAPIRPLLLFAALVACEASSPRPHRERAPARAASALVGPEEDESRELRGRISGHDGRPLAFAAVSMIRFGEFGPTTVVTAGDDGSFTIPVEPDAKLGALRVVGTGHAVLELPVDLRDRALELDIQLGTESSARKSPEKLWAFIGRAVPSERLWSGTPLGELERGEGLPPVFVQRGEGGVYTATVETADPGIFYALVDPTDGQRVVPTLAEGPRTRYDGWFVWSYAPAQGGRVVLRHDPSRLPPPDLAPKVDALGEATEELVQAQLAALAWGPAEAGLPPAGAEVCGRAAAAARESSGPGGALLWIRYTTFAALRGCEISDADAHQALARIAADDPLWALDVQALARTTEPLRADDRALVERYEDAVIERHAVASLVGYLLIERLKAAGDDLERARALAKQLREERFTLTWAGAQVRELDPDAVKAGKPVPEFSVPALGGGPPISRASLLGKPAVIEFWGTWCRPCVEQLPELHALWARANKVRAPADAAGWQSLAPPADPQVRFVSISIHDEAETVAEFRRTKWPMPWQHAALAEEQGKAIMDQFYFSGVPTVFFVDAKGVVVQRDGDHQAGLRKATKG